MAILANHHELWGISIGRFMGDSRQVAASSVSGRPHRRDISGAAAWWELRQGLERRGSGLKGSFRKWWSSSRLAARDAGFAHGGSVGASAAVASSIRQQTRQQQQGGSGTSALTGFVRGSDVVRDLQAAQNIVPSFVHRFVRGQRSRQRGGKGAEVRRRRLRESGSAPALRRASTAAQMPRATTRTGA